MRKIAYKERFENELMFIVEFIAQHDGYQRAEKFYNEIYAKIDKIPFMPFSYRQNKLTSNKNTKDIYKGYVIPFRITNDKIEILGIYKENLWAEKD
ncbi:type II toxin-antitoxin system RelE/ParE family toxin [Campylobacter sp. JMF_04 NA10]|uniref:type II toxin-antitoxin system RelE/ParE family toxin n=1 Tax=Campylobacter sp. JMF_04 NA10 TaxID=2983824 RepID=UPI0022E9D833|nr:type II toxin-antitoxin system RelE/ParE family toxin [Campylobacter sp. JMF_04 NA10]MDA3076438.1 type II toxin-antitoxin system RelE/ParE family toxin [Campylobacter sp. JMF_04 NA10]